MDMAYRVDIKGFTELEKALNKFINVDFEAVNRKAVAAAVDVLEREEVQQAPVATKPTRTYQKKYRQPGNLKAAIQSKQFRPKYPGVSTAYTGPTAGRRELHDAFYASWVHEGHRIMVRQGTRRDRRYKRQQKMITNWVYGGRKTKPNRFIRRAFEAKKQAATEAAAAIYRQALRKD
jgi:hypothetical protein